MPESNETLRILAATALIMLIFEGTKAYDSATPDLRELREAPANDPDTLQTLVDADITVGIPVLLAGVVASVVMRSWLPIVVTTVAMLAVGGYHHSILSDPTTKG